MRPVNPLSKRRGMVLLIVMAMLALFATVGLGFVFYSQSEADSARMQKSVQDLTVADVTPERLAAYAIGQILYGTDNTASKFRNMDMARSMYGGPGGVRAYNGLGYDTNPGPIPPPLTLASVRGADPGTDTRLDGSNAPWTYPDLNSPFLAGIKGDGSIVHRSYVRGATAELSLGTPASDAEGHVRNVFNSGGYSGKYNDSFWMDMGFPILTTRDGVRYKPLAAPFIVDLDNRGNLAIVGNYLANYNGAPGNYASRMGIGPWEINLAQILNPSATLNTELQQLFRGKASVLASGRLGAGGGAGQTPDNVVPGSWLPGSTNTYAYIPYGGTESLPLGSNAVPAGFRAYPKFDGWTSNPAGQNLPMMFQYFQANGLGGAGATDTRLAASAAEALFRAGERNSPGVTSNAIRFMQSTLDPATQTRLHNLTTYSMAFDVPHMAPLGDFVYKLVAGQTLPSPTAQQAASGSEFAPNLKSAKLAATLARLDLSKDTSANATTIYTALRTLYHVQNPLLIVDAEEKAAAKWLAQFAVNLADYMDGDNVSTAFLWTGKTIGGMIPITEDDYVFGVEQSRLVLNEAYASLDNDGMDASLKNKTPTANIARLNVWAEFYNPQRAEGALVGKENLDGYRLILCRNASGIATSALGTPSSPLSAPIDRAEWPAANKVVLPGDGNAAANGFYLVGPVDHWEENKGKGKGKMLGVMGVLDERTPILPTLDHASESLSVSIPFPDNEADLPRNPTLVLQRLANPFAAEQNDPTMAGYNPYITVDVFENITTHDSYIANKTASVNPAALETFTSTGRRQPMAATSVVAQKIQTAQQPNAMDKPYVPQQTFLRQNHPSLLLNETVMPFTGTAWDWHIHLDRPLVNRGEILNVAVVPPSQVTQRFPNSSGTLAGAVCGSPAADNSLLSRLLEFFYVPSLQYNQNVGIVNGAYRVPGKININTIWDEEILKALLDPQEDTTTTPPTPITRFKASDVSALFAEIQKPAYRPSSGYSHFSYDGTTVTYKPGLMKAFAEKIFNNSTANNRPYDREEAYRKVANNITFTSNAFAVWLTFGFFEVDANGNVTSTEVGASENRQIRHRTFAIVDRTKLLAPSGQLTTVKAIKDLGAVSATHKRYEIEPNLFSGTSSFTANLDWPSGKVAWKFVPGMTVKVKNEVVKIVSTTPSNGKFQADFPIATPPAVNDAVAFETGITSQEIASMQYGHPGPQPLFNFRDYAYVVPFVSIID